MDLICQQCVYEEESIDEYICKKINDCVRYHSDTLCKVNYVSTKIINNSNNQCYYYSFMVEE